ncbi:MAG TPA: tetratricopeptide repeat protein [Candidatus Cybelea sp.]|jgi:class 3 adenylate cyclase/Tfp pilus assembly protein PilF
MASPTGVVTFAFTDIEGSTARWERDRVAMQDAVRRHDAILREAIGERGGYVFKTIGDAFCAAFARPDDAVAAMLDAQQRLAVEDFSAVDGLRVRAAIHSGTADEREGDYFGPTLNKVARLLAIGYGGQILLTNETAALTASALPADLALRDLGTYHLKDFRLPQRVHQLLAPGLPSEFPPLRSLGTLPSDLSIIDAAEFRAVPGFSGRDDELAAVHAALKTDGAVALVHGLGGVGKSSIAREYGWRHRDAYSVVWWLNAQTGGDVIDGLVRFGTMFAQGLEQLADRRAAAQRVINSVLGGFDKPVFLVFDNLEDEGLLRTWLPRTGTRALVTSREAAISSDIISIPLRVWSLEIAVAYLQSASGRADLSEADARAIALALGGLPLALAHAAAALRGMRMISPARYLQRINEHLKNAPRGADYPHSVFATFSESILHAEQQAPGAAAALCFAACFAPDAIPDELLHQVTGDGPERLVPVVLREDGLDLRSALADDSRLDQALAALDRLDLLAFVASSRSYGMHRLVQFAARDLRQDVPAWAEYAVAAAFAVFPSPEFATWPQCERVLAHARAALDAVRKDAEPLTVADLARRCGIYLWARGEYGESERLFARTLAILEKALEPEHPDVARALNNLGVLYMELGRYTDAEPLLARALAIRENEFGPAHPIVAKSLHNLGIVSMELAQYPQAESRHARALTVRENAFGPNHPETLWSQVALGVLYRYEGRYAEAEPLLAHVLTTREETLGADHPDVAMTLMHLADVYVHSGRSGGAEQHYLRALAIWEKALGPDHPDVAEGLKGLASVYRAQGRVEKSELLLTRALTIREKTLGPDHPTTKATREALDALGSSQH